MKIANEAREEMIENLEGLRPEDPAVGARFGSTEYALQTFESRIQDLEDFNVVAQSYGMQPGNLLAIFVLEGAFGRRLYVPPSTTLDAAGLVSWHLWQRHGMDDFAVTYRPPGASDNRFNKSSSGHRSAIISTLANFYGQGLLWNSQSLRPDDPRDQLTPEQILTELLNHVNTTTQLPDDGFIPLVYRIQAATLASRQQLIGRSQRTLSELGYEPEVAAQFRHRSVEIERVRIARENNLFPAVVSSDSDRVRWTYRHLDDPEFARALFSDERYRNLLETSFEQRMSPEVARITMGTPAGAAHTITTANQDFQRWQRQQANREAMYRWALDMNVNLIILQGGQIDEARTLELLNEIQNSINDTNIPHRAVRRSIQANFVEFIRTRNYGGMDEYLHYIINTVERFSHVNSTRDWIASLEDSYDHPDIISRTVINYLHPTSSAFRGRIRHVLSIYEQSTRFAQGLVEARQALE